MNFGLLIIALIGGTVGILSTVYLLFSFPSVLLWKIYRKVTKGIPLTKQMFIHYTMQNYYD